LRARRVKAEVLRKGGRKITAQAGGEQVETRVFLSGGTVTLNNNRKDETRISVLKL
jgi:hypothetical protein